MKTERISRTLKTLKKKDKSAEPSENQSQTETDLDIYGDLDASKSLLLHGLQSDFIEEEMSDDKEFRFSLSTLSSVNLCHRVASLFNIFRKEVLEQKVSTILVSVNFTRKIKYKVGEG